jgi:hypothetical protein
MSIATGIVRDLLVVAVVASRDVSAQRGGAAGADCGEHPLLRTRQAMAGSSEERGRLAAKDVGDFQRRA